jgi:predicted RNase H-like HicB family nuclease
MLSSARCAVRDLEAQLAATQSLLTMSKQKYVYWKDDDTWLGYLDEFPDYWTQGETEDDLREHLADLYKELTSGAIPNVRRVAELDIA